MSCEHKINWKQFNTAKSSPPGAAIHWIEIYDCRVWAEVVHDIYFHSTLLFLWELFAAVSMDPKTAHDKHGDEGRMKVNKNCRFLILISFLHALRFSIYHQQPRAKRTHDTQYLFTTSKSHEYHKTSHSMHENTYRQQSGIQTVRQVVSSRFDTRRCLRKVNVGKIKFYWDENSDDDAGHM